MWNPRFCAALFAGLIIGSTAQAATLTIEPVGGIWSSSIPTVDGIGSTQLTWGQPKYDQKSGYHFEAYSAFTVENDTPFVIGAFTHQNFPVKGPFLESAQLKVSFKVDGLANPIHSTFSFDHLETPNDDAICANGAAHGVGVNASGCADRVLATLNESQSQSFEIGGTTYVLDVLGFQYGGKTLDSFWTEENRANTAQLIATFTTESSSGEPPVSPVPLPASGLLLATITFAGVAIGRRRSEKVKKLRDS